MTPVLADFGIVEMVLVVIFVLFVLSFLLGTWIISTKGTPPPSADPCDQCNRDKEVYDSYEIGMKMAVAAWWVINRAKCKAKGC